MQIKTLLESINIQRASPINMLAKEEILFEHEFEKTLPKMSLLELKNVWITPQGVILKNFKIIPHSLLEFTAHQKQTTFGLRYLLRTLVKNKKRNLDSSKKYLMLFDTSSFGYCHWISDSLPRLYVMREKLADYIIFLPENHNFPHVLDTLKIFGVKEIVFFSMENYVFVPNLHLPTHSSTSGNPRPKLYRDFRYFLLDKCKDKLNFNLGDKIYVSRSKAQRRHITNESEVIDLVKKYDFEIVYFEEYNFFEQMSLMYHAKYFISIHGAGFTNVTFMKPNTNALELRLENDASNNIYYALTTALEINYWYQSCPSNNQNYQFSSGNPYDLEIDIEKLKQNIEKMIGNQ